MTTRLSMLLWLVCEQRSTLLWLLSPAPASRSEAPAEGRKCCREGSAHQICRPQAAQSRANVACSLHDHGLMYYLPCVSQQTSRPAHFTSLSILFCSVLSLLWLYVLICTTDTSEAPLSGPYLVQCHQMCSGSPSVLQF